MDYRLPRTFEVPGMEHIIVETNDPYGPFGAKEVGEGPIACNPHAIAGCGKQCHWVHLNGVSAHSRTGA